MINPMARMLLLPWIQVKSSARFALKQKDLIAKLMLCIQTAQCLHVHVSQPGPSHGQFNHVQAQDPVSPVNEQELLTKARQIRLK